MSYSSSSPGLSLPHVDNKTKLDNQYDTCSNRRDSDGEAHHYSHSYLQPSVILIHQNAFYKFSDHVYPPPATVITVKHRLMITKVKQSHNQSLKFSSLMIL